MTRLTWLLLAAGLVRGLEAQDQDQKAASVPSSERAATSRRAPPEPWFLRGRLTSRYYLRWTGDASDQDLYETLAVEIGDPERLPVTGYFMGRLAADLDGIEKDDTTFASLDDTFNHAVDLRAYDAYADVHTVGGIPVLRFGRQLISDTPEVAYFDGARLESSALGETTLKLGAYGGVSTHTYESSHTGDWTFGGYADARPWKGSWARLDWMYFEDESVLGGHNNNLLGARFSQTFSKQVAVELQYTRFWERDRDARARVTYSELESGLVLSVSYYQLLSTQRELVLELDPFFTALHELYPFQQFSALGSKRFSEHFEVEAGLDLRHVLDSADEGEFNRDYQRGHGTARFDDLVLRGLSVGLTADVWNSSGQQTRTWGFDVTQKIGERWRAEAGSYYSLYKFDLYLNEERDHVRTYYGKVHHDPSKALALAGSLEIEDNDLDLFYVMMLEAKWRF